MKEIDQAKASWDQFLSKYRELGLSEIDDHQDFINLLDLVVYAQKDEYIKFDQIFNSLPKRQMYSEDFLPTIYQFFVRRKMPDTAFSFLNEGIAYIEEIGKEPSSIVIRLRENAVDEVLIERIKVNMMGLRNLPAKNVPSVIPGILNGKRSLNEFILCEILQGLRTMRGKIKAVESIKHEDHFNDIFLATVRLRLHVWGWELSDQDRQGGSPKGVDAGELDLTINAAGMPIALIEALQMSGKNIAELRKHVKKCENYNRDIRRFYLVVYYRGSRHHFADFFSSYQADISIIPYSENWKYNADIGFRDLCSEFTDVENIHVGKTIHGNTKLELYHVIIDLSDPE